MLINQGCDHRNNGGCKGASSIATYSAPAAPAARVSRSSKGAEWLGWVGNSLSRHMTQAMDTWSGALQMGRLGTCRHHSVHSMQGSSRPSKGYCMEYHTHSATLAALGSGLAVRGRRPCLVLINQGCDHRNNGGCKGASSIATYSAPAAPAARVSRSSKEAEWLGWVGNSLSRHMTQAMDTWSGALQVGRLGTCRHHSVHSMQGSSRPTRATAWNTTHTVQHWLHWAVVWL